MKSTYKYLFLLTALIGFNSCEEIIDVPLDNAAERIIVEGVLNDRLGESYILLSMTGTVYDDSGFEKLSNAVITVTDKDGSQTSFIEDLAEPGRYIAPAFKTTAKNSYKLDVFVSGETITASSLTNSKPIIDSTAFELIPAAFESGGADSYIVSYYSKDPLGEQNNYRVRIWINQKESDIFYLGNDDFIDGQNYNGPFWGTHPESGDTVNIELVSMDESMYRYYTQLSNNLDQSPFSATPSNPVGNLEGNAIGYFGSFTTDTISLILP